jgi:ATP-dependent metalloprotease
LFAAARKKAPAIIFIDELDAIGSKRSAKDQVSNTDKAFGELS